MLRTKLNRRAFEIAITKRNISQNHAAQKIGVSKTHLSQLVTGKKSPSPATRQRILDYFQGSTFDDFFVIEVSDDDE